MSGVQDVLLERLGDTVDEVVIVEWLVRPGEPVAAGEALARVETDKVEVDVAAPVSGVLISQEVAEGDELQTGGLLCRIMLA